MSKGAINELHALVGRLQRGREIHVAAIGEIDAAFERLGVGAGKPVRRGRRPGRPKKAAPAGKRPMASKGRKRRSFSMTANELVLSTIKTAGAKGATGTQIGTAWKKAGRPGTPYNTLGLLTKAKSVKRLKVVAGERGSRYTLA